MPQQHFQFKFDRTIAGLGLGLFLLGLAVRLFGIQWGLPNDIRNHSLHPDEEIIFAYSQRIEPSKGVFTPGFYNYGTLYLTILRVSTDVVMGYGGGPQKEDGSDLHLATARFHLAGRIISAVAGSILAWVIVALLADKIGILGAGAGGLVCAIAPGLVVHSRFQTVDIVATLFTALSLFYIANLPKAKDVTKFAVLAGVWAGLSAGTKYTGALLVPAIFVGIWLATRNSKRPILQPAGLAFAAFFGCFVLATPGILLDTASFIRDFKYEGLHTSTGHGLVFASTAPGPIFHLANLGATLGILMTVLGLGGLFILTKNKHAWIAGPILFAALYFILIARAEVKFLRYVFPLVPVLACGFGALVSRLHSHSNPNFKFGNVFAIVALMGLGDGGLMGTLTHTAHMMSPDVRDSAGNYLKEKKQSVGIVEDGWFYSPTLYPEIGVSRALPFAQRFEFQRRAPFPVLQVFEPNGARPTWDTRLIDQLAPERIVFSSFEFDDLDRISRAKPVDPAFADQANRFTAFMEKLATKYEIETVYGSDGSHIHDLMYIRPTVWIWKKKPN